MNKNPKEKLTIKIEADVAKCLSGLDLVQKRLDGIEASIKRLASMNVNVTGIIRGNDLILPLKRAGDSLKRFS